MTTLILARVQFAFTTIFHMIWPVLTVGLGLFMVILEIMWIRTNEAAYYHQVRFWSKIFLLSFSIGVATGLVMEFEFGTNWEGFSASTHGFFGDILGFEGTLAFMLEAGFLGIMVFGWNKVPRGVHLLSTILVAFGASLSAFWILVANSWMQTPTGGEWQNGLFIVTDYLRALLNPDMPWATSHMWVACVEATAFVVGGISVWFVARGRHVEMFIKSLKIAVVVAIAAAPLQVFIGDQQGLVVGRDQPAKLAAMESHWETNAAGTGAPWNMIARPDRTRQRNAWQIQIPGVLSFLETRSWTGQVQGLREFPRQDQPPIVLPFYAFRIMVAIGFFLVALAFWTVFVWARGGLTAEGLGSRRLLVGAWIASVPLGHVAVEMGWIVREIGRQPWVIYNRLRIEEAYSHHPSWAVGTTLLGLFIVYGLLFALFLIFARRILRAGPDNSQAPPALPARGGDKEAT